MSLPAPAERPFRRPCDALMLDAGTRAPDIVEKDRASYRDPHGVM